MATEFPLIGRNPIQITSGNDSAAITVLSGKILFVDSAVMPQNLDEGDYLDLRQRIIISPPMSVWVWAEHYDSKIALHKW